MATLSNQPDAVMMAWYRAKKFGVVRPPYAGAGRETKTGSFLSSGKQAPPRPAG